MRERGQNGNAASGTGRRPLGWGFFDRPNGEFSTGVDTATVWREGNWYVSQCLELDIASQGESEDEALANLKEAPELHFEPPQATRPPKVRTIEVEVGAP